LSQRIPCTCATLEPWYFYRTSCSSRLLRFKTPVKAIAKPSKRLSPRATAAASSSRPFLSPGTLPLRAARAASTRAFALRATDGTSSAKWEPDLRARTFSSTAAASLRSRPSSCPQWKRRMQRPRGVNSALQPVRRKLHTKRLYHRSSRRRQRACGCSTNCPSKCSSGRSHEPTRFERGASCAIRFTFLDGGLLARKQQTNAQHRIGVEADGFDAHPYQLAGKLRIVRRCLTADADVAAVTLGSVNSRAHHFNDARIPLVEIERH